MVQHVWERARASRADRVLVATDDDRIGKACRTFGAEALMTLDSHPTGTDRLAEVVDTLGFDDAHIVVNVQGDEPLIPPAVIDQVAANLANAKAASIATLCEPITDAATLGSEHVVKVSFDQQGLALLFSRAVIPWPRGFSWESGAMPTGNWYRHLGIYAYRVGFLRRYTAWAPSAMEETESLEQLRALDHGERIHVAEAAEAVPGGIDTPEDLEALRRRLQAGQS